MKAETTTGVEELLNELVGRVAGEVGLILFSLGIEGEFTDDQLSLELGIEINEIRKALFALYEIGLADYVRRRDDETGWMEYYWRINYDKALDVLKRELEKTAKKLREKIEAETSTIYYICPTCALKCHTTMRWSSTLHAHAAGQCLTTLTATRPSRKLRRRSGKLRRF